MAKMIFHELLGYGKNKSWWDKHFPVHVKRMINYSDPLLNLIQLYSSWKYNIDKTFPIQHMPNNISDE